MRPLIGMGTTDVDPFQASEEGDYFHYQCGIICHLTEEMNSYGFMYRLYATAITGFYSDV